ncbi:MAG: GNAT family N-acetyltransferase [Betaproteobacteria bacterium]|nr:GNAT family N-acetyltransferase [Betaproteobacteria bacterium]
MTVRNLEFLFRPRSVAVVSEPDEPSRYAEVVERNLAAGGFSGPVVPVSAHRRSRLALGARMRLEPAGTACDLAVICARLENIPDIVTQLGERGTRAILVGPSLRERFARGEAAALRNAILAAARPYLMRVLGPGSGGLMVPALGLNASVAPAGGLPGKIALVTQSTAVASAVVDRAFSRRVGFSTVVHLGGMVDVDLADTLDWLAEDPDTERILVQFDTVANGRKFMSAARAAARNKPVVAIRGGRIEAGPVAGTPFLATEVYDAALRRAGWVQIETLDDVFEAAEAMDRVRPLRGERLAILANGRGLGNIAAATLVAGGGSLATLAGTTLEQVGRQLQTRATLTNPLALPADVRADGWAGALATVLADPGVDAALTVCSPSPFAASTDIATEICKVSRGTEANVFTCWVGGASMLSAQEIASAYGVLSHDSPERAVAVFLGIVHYQHNRELLMQMPPSLPEGFVTDGDGARALVAESLERGAAALTWRQARRLLECYAIDAVDYVTAASVDTAVEAANGLGYPVDLGLVLGDATRFDTLASNLHSPAELQAAARALRATAHSRHAGVRIAGYRLRRGVAWGGSVALRVGVAEDPVFGPVIHVARATPGARMAIGLPPLNAALAGELVERGACFDDIPPADRPALAASAAGLLVRLSQLLTDVGGVSGIDLDPVVVAAGEARVLAADVRIVRRERRQGVRRFAIRPYPKELERRIDWDGRHLLIRPIRPEDEETLGDLLNSLAPEDSRMRFFDTMRKLPRSQLARFTQIDYDREMALVAIERDAAGRERSLGEVRAMADPDHTVADFAVVVDSAMKGRGLGRLLLTEIIEYARAKGIGELRGETLAGNLRMQSLARSLGFSVRGGDDPGAVDLRLALGDRHAAGGTG